MTFQEALKAMLERKQVARSAWDGIGEYIVVMPGMQHVWKIMTQPNPNAGNWLPLVEDMLSTDWQIFDNVEDKVEELAAE